MTNENANAKEHENEEVELSEVVDDLSFFMPGGSEEVEEVSFPVSTRFRDKEGKIIKFRFKPIPTPRVDELEKECTVPVYSGSRRKKVGERVDQSRFIARVAVESTIYPDLKSAELRKAYSEQDPIAVAKKVLPIAGEYAKWLQIASEVNGFEDTVEDLEEAAKN